VAEVNKQVAEAVVVARHAQQVEAVGNIAPHIRKPDSRSRN